MADLTTHYLGLTLRNPIIAGSSGLTSSIEGIKNLEKNGVGAVVLKSLFEEQVIIDAENQLRQAKKNQMIYTDRSESMDYIDYHIKGDYVSDYLNLIREVKQKTLLPVIGSINCVTSGEWISFSRQIEEAGADALELNFSFLNANPNKSAESVDALLLDIVKKVKEHLNIPLSVKLSPYFCNIAQLTQKLSIAGVKGLVLFNRYFTPDIDINSQEITNGNMYSTPMEYTNSLRWTSILSDRVEADIAASCGIHDGKTALKLLLAGAKVCQVVSTLYKNGYDIIPKMLDDIESWMSLNGYNYTLQFTGILNQYKSKDPSTYERIQFMRYYSGIGMS